MCLVNCPFGAIADKSQIFQMIRAIKQGDKVGGRRGPRLCDPVRGQGAPPLRCGRPCAGWASPACGRWPSGADLCTIEEAKDYLEKVPEELPFLATSCCPAWSVMAKKLFPQFTENISMALTPMVLTARLDQDGAPRRPGWSSSGPAPPKSWRPPAAPSAAMWTLCSPLRRCRACSTPAGVDLSQMPADPEKDFHRATGAGRGFAVTGGVAQAVVQGQPRPSTRSGRCPCQYADGLRECKKMLAMAKAGKYKGYLLEGMGCPGGCVAGAGTITPAVKSTAAVKNYAAQAAEDNAVDSRFAAEVSKLEQ